MRRFAPLLMLLGCINPADLEELRENQERIRERLQALEAKLETSPNLPPNEAPSEPPTLFAFPIGSAPQRGPKDAWVTIIASSNFQCPFCKRVTATLEKVLKRYPEDVRLVFKHNPLAFHKRAMPAAIAAECAHAQGRFWPMHDLIFESQRQLEDDDLKAHAQKLELDMSRWQRCFDMEEPKSRIKEDQRIAVAQDMRGTPNFLINGRAFKGAQPFERFIKVIDEELQLARQSGVPRSAYYERRVMARGAKNY